MADQSNEMGMVEYVAAAIYPGIWDDDFGPHLTDAAIASLRGRAIKTARAAIEAMSVPTETMITAGAEEYGHPNGVIVDIYGAILDAALSHDEVKG